MTTSKDKVNELRKLMKQKKLDAYLVTSTDPHQSEYLPEHWKAREWISGFTGSAGTIVITHDFAGLWTDSRYFIQAERELKGSGIELMKLNIPHTPEYVSWIEENLPEKSTLGCDGNCVSYQMVKYMIESFTSRHISIETRHDLISEIWPHRPGLSDHQVFEHPVEFATRSRKQKIKLVREKLKELKCDYQLLSSLDDIAWVFNLRGSDVDFNPVFVSYAVISMDDAHLFTDEKKIPSGIREKLQNDAIKIKPYQSIGEYLDGLERASVIYTDFAKTSFNVVYRASRQTIIKNGKTIPAQEKSCKTSEEIRHIKNAMTKDGVALVKFFRWLESKIGSAELTEISAAGKLREFRSMQKDYVGDSFATIAGFNEHGAIVHYCANEESNYQITKDGMLLIDSGGQYMDGTTDITRTICTGKPTREQIADYTSVLKGLIRLTQCYFPEGTKGFHLDSLARSPLWQHLRNYGHGTGHGVGYFLNVHEGPQGISPNSANDQELLPGMIQSNEPGIYLEDRYGIRLENLIVVDKYEKNEFGAFYLFETLTLFPFELELIDKEILNEEELGWLNRYHNKVFETLSPHLSKEDNQWLLKKTRWIN